VFEEKDADMTVTNALLTVDGVTSGISLFERVELIGGDSGNVINATGFTGVSGALLVGGAGVDTITGTGNDDTITGGGSGDTVDGGGGTDTIVETRDADFTLADVVGAPADDATLVIGAEGVDALTSVERALFTGGDSANTIDASGFTLGSVTLIGEGGDDILRGGSQDDFLTGGAGLDQAFGNGGTDTLIEQADSKFVATNGSLDMGEGDDEIVTLTLGSSIAANTDGTFTLTFDGDTTVDLAHDITATELKSRLSELAGINDEQIRVETTYDTLAGTTNLADLRGGGAGGGVAITAAGTNDIEITLSDGSTTVAIDLDGAITVQDVLDAITNADGGGRLLATVNAAANGIDVMDTTDDGEDIKVLGINDSLAALHLGIESYGDGDTVEGMRITGRDGWTITFAGDQAGKNVANMALNAAGITTGSLGLAISQGSQGLNTLNSVEQLDLTGGLSGNLMDARLFTLGPVKLVGQAGDDRLFGSNQADDLDAGIGNDLVTGGGGADAIAGGAGVDTLVEQSDAASIVLTNTALVMDGVTDTLSGFEIADLTGGPSANAIDASGFNGVSEDTPLWFLNNLDGVGVAGGVPANLTGLEAQTPLSALNDADGVSTTASGTDDLRITLSDGTTDVDIDLGDAETVQDVLDAITGANPALTATLNALGNGIDIADATGGVNALVVSALNSSDAAADLGILGLGTTALMAGTIITGGGADIRIVLSDGITEVDVDLYFAQTIQEVLDVITESHANLSAALNAAKTAIVVTDSTGGASNVVISDTNGATAATDLGLAGTGTTAGRVGANISAGYVTIDGAGDADTIDGTGGDDFITGGAGGDDIDGGGGTDTLIEARDDDFTLLDNQLTIGAEVDTLAGIEHAELAGGASANTLDASAFTMGSVVLDTGATDPAAGGFTDLGPNIAGDAGIVLVDILKGTANDDLFIVNVGNLTSGSHEVQVAPGASAGNVVNVVGLGGTVDASDLGWIDWDPAASVGNAALAFGSDSTDTLTVAGNLDTNGQSLVFKGENIYANGVIVDTGATNSAGNILFDSRHVHLTDTKLLAVSDVGNVRGNIIIEAIDDRANVTALGFANVDLLSTNIDIVSTTPGMTEIRGGAVNFLATADSQRILRETDFGDSFFGEYAAGATNSLLLGIENFSAFVGVAVAKSETVINVDANTTIDADTFSAIASTAVRTKASPVSIGGGVAVGVAITDAEVNFSGSLVTVGDATFRATSDHIVDVVADASGIKGLAGAIAVSVLDSNTRVHITESADLTVGDDLFVQSDIVDRNRTMARSTTGSTGNVGVSIAVAVENGDTLAYLDGEADVVGNINVTALQSKEAVNVYKAFIVPGMVTGVNATAGVGTDSKGDLLDDAKSSAVGVLANPLKTAIMEKLGKDPLKTSGRSVQVGAAIAVSLDNNLTEARIGGGTTATDVEADGVINVTSKISNRPDVTAASSVEDDPKATKGKGVTGPASFSGSFAVGFGLYTADADAYIGENANVDAKGDITVLAEAHNEIDPLGLWGANLVAPFLDKNTEATYDTDDGQVTLSGGDTVDVLGGHTAGGNVETRYKYVGPEGDDPVLGDEDFSDELRWEDVGNPANNTAFNFIRTFSTYLDGNLGLDNNLVDTWGQASAKATKIGVAGTVMIHIQDHDADATIKAGAQINQDVDGVTDSDNFDVGGRDVIVEASSIEHTISLGGNFQTLGVQGSTNPKTWSAGEIIQTPGLGNEGDKTKGAVGFGGLVLFNNSLARARIEDGVFLTADSLEVDADNTILNIAVAVSGGEAGQFGFNGAFVYNEVDNVTRAQIENGAFIDVGSDGVGDSDANGASVFVDANDTTTLITVAGAVSISSQVGVGASVAINNVTRDTDAIIGNFRDDASVDTRRTFTADGDVFLKAVNDGFVAAVAVSGSKVSTTPDADATGDSGMKDRNGNSQDDPGKLPNNQKNYDSVIAQLKGGSGESSSAASDSNSAGNNKGKTGIAISGAVTINTVDDEAFAYVFNSGAVTVDGGNSLIIRGKDDSIHASIAGAVAISQSSGTSTSIGIAGAVGLNFIGGGTKAYIDGATSIETGGIDMDAELTGWTVSLTAGVAGATGVKGIGIAGSVAVTRVVMDVETALKNTTGPSNTGGISMNAVDDSNIVLVAGAGAYGGKVGVGAAIAFSEIENTIKSTVDNVTDLKHTGAFEVLASTDADIIAVTGAGGVAKGGGGGASFGAAGTLSINFIENTVEAAILNSTTHAASTGLVKVEAVDDSYFFAFAGAIGYGGSLGLGAGLALNFMDNTVRAKVEGSTIRTTGGFQVKASETGVMTTIAAGGAGSDKFAIAGGIAANQFTNEIDAHVSGGSDVAVGGAVRVEAKDNATIVSVAGGVAFSSKAAIGASVGVNLIGDTVRAYVDGSTVKSTGSTTAIEASAEELIVAIGIGG
ncbi:MAG: hypothetical protein DWQ08_13065, partial [Proteobacteria bacterium]